ncbi:bifunctional non-homologous end joining protein LigD [Lysobacter sp. yr284]|uniref:DNA ligase D n=1 Tax=Lysobacter sp. yr284 TaxID=1761791 RepID=UPI0008955EA1|nr:DNA ligase D [Lysobacter sp. yr284]SDY65584.1 bifunctional non-homologous end joining protein LigD [Lysobacter sp. yr284]
MSLHEYQRKRRFDRTREPEPGAPPRGERAIFVVQLHHASHRHYDFRLQVGDALKSWAVPKGPSYDPAVKRMAVEVEDHPLGYAGFEGEIPHGEYGGGHVARFDTGVWATDGDPQAQLAKGHLRFELFGRKLKGGWHLVRSGKPARQPQWLLFKDRDEYAGTLEADDLLADVASPPAADAQRAGRGKPRKRRLAEVAPARARRRDWAAAARKLTGARTARFEGGAFELQLARLVDAPPPGEQWLHELKWDGYRIGIGVAAGRARLWSRNALEWTRKIPEIAAAVEALGLDSAALDGELIAGRGTREDFNLLQATLSGEKQGALSLVVFDLLHVDGWDLSAAPLLQRKALLEQLLQRAGPHLRYSSHILGDGERAYTLADEQGFEGIVSKRADRAHHPGRSDEWRKSKRLASDEFAVVGYTPPKGARSGFGALLLARPDPAHGWSYAGRVGSGFSADLLARISKRLPRGAAAPTVHVPPHDTDLRAARWFAPAFVVEAFYRGVGGHGLLRQASFKTLRADKTPAALADGDRGPGAAARLHSNSESDSESPPIRTAMTRKAAKASAGKAKADKTRAGKPQAAADLDDFRLTSPERVVYPDIGASKRDVAAYYLAMADWLLPEIADRPLSIVRCTQGAARPCFFQKHHTAGLEDVDSVSLEEESGQRADYLVVRDLAGLMNLVQFNALEFHPWGAKAPRPDRADRIVFDLDPGSGVPWSEVVSAARQLRSLLTKLELQSFVRTSGGKGLHVVVPLKPGCDWDLVKPFAHSFAETLAQMEPLKYIATATKKFRNGKIFVDYLRNGRGATSVASFSLRAREGAPVAMPLRWEDLGKVKSGHAFDIRSAQARVKRLRRHPWAGIDAVRQDLDRLSERLQRLRPDD